MRKVAVGYSGYGEGKNNPELQHVRNVGPIPRGAWHIGDVYDSNNIGPFAIKLEPAGHDALQRTYFRIHGDSASNPGNASRGCMIFSREVRTVINQSDDRYLLVIE